MATRRMVARTGIRKKSHKKPWRLSIEGSIHVELGQGEVEHTPQAHFYLNYPILPDHVTRKTVPLLVHKRTRFKVAFELPVGSVVLENSERYELGVLPQFVQIVVRIFQAKSVAYGSTKGLVCGKQLAVANIPLEELMRTKEEFTVRSDCNYVGDFFEGGDGVMLVKRGSITIEKTMHDIGDWKLNKSVISVQQLERLMYRNISYLPQLLSPHMPDDSRKDVYDRFGEDITMWSYVPPLVSGISAMHMGPVWLDHPRPIPAMLASRLTTGYWLGDQDFYVQILDYVLEQRTVFAGTTVISGYGSKTIVQKREWLANVVARQFEVSYMTNEFIEVLDIILHMVCWYATMHQYDSDYSIAAKTMQDWRRVHTTKNTEERVDLAPIIDGFPMGGDCDDSADANYRFAIKLRESEFNLGYSSNIAAVSVQRVIRKLYVPMFATAAVDSPKAGEEEGGGDSLACHAVSLLVSRELFWTMIENGKRELERDRTIGDEKQLMLNSPLTNTDIIDGLMPALFTEGTAPPNLMLATNFMRRETTEEQAQFTKITEQREEWHHLFTVFRKTCQHMVADLNVVRIPNEEIVFYRYLTDIQLPIQETGVVDCAAMYAATVTSSGLRTGINVEDLFIRERWSSLCLIASMTLVSDEEKDAMDTLSDIFVPPITMNSTPRQLDHELKTLSYTQSTSKRVPFEDERGHVIRMALGLVHKSVKRWDSTTVVREDAALLYVRSGPISNLFGGKMDQYATEIRTAHKNGVIMLKRVMPIHISGLTELLFIFCLQSS